MKLLSEVLNLSIQYLKDRNVEAPRLTAETLLSHVLGIKRMDLYLDFERPLEEEELVSFRPFLKRAGLGEPIEYILGSLDFFDLEVIVSPGVLIPRQETEILVAFVAEVLGKEDLQGKALWDVCSGSGCIGLSLKKKFPHLSVFLSDQSSDALAICRRSMEKQDLDVTLCEGDFLKPLEGRKTDFFVCNPPYISEQEYQNLSPSVRDFEPKMALVGGKTGLEFYRRLAEELPSVLNPGARVFLGIGYRQGRDVIEIFSSSCWVKKELKQDWSGNDRFFFLEIE